MAYSAGNYCQRRSDDADINRGEAASPALSDNRQAKSAVARAKSALCGCI